MGHQRSQMVPVCVLTTVFGIALGFGCAEVRERPESAAATRMEVDSRSQAAGAVLVRNAALLHTAQLFPTDARGVVVGGRDVSRQVAQVMENLQLVLSGGGSRLKDVVKLNICVNGEQIAPQAQVEFSQYLKDMHNPAVSWVTGSLACREALVAVDAVAISSAQLPAGDPGRFRVAGLETLRGAAGAILPQGGKYYISGQAKKGRLREATSDTLKQLGQTLTNLGMTRMNVVQIRAFLNEPLEESVVQSEVSKFFGLDLPPPMIFVEWHGQEDSPMEIEMIAADPWPDDGGRGTVEFLTPPGLTSSRLFSRVAHVIRGGTIYFSSITGTEKADARIQMEEIFGKLGGLLRETGSDFGHLVKAIYYVTDEDAGNQLNELRPKYFIPDRAPAASKAVVTGVAAPGKTVSFDMIAVTK